MASMEINGAVTNEMLKRAFDFYDEVTILNHLQNKNGVITFKDLSRVFGTFSSEKIIKDFMQEADIDGDGQITFNEFKEVMLRLKKKTSKVKYSWSL